MKGKTQVDWPVGSHFDMLGFGNPGAVRCRYTYNGVGYSPYEVFGWCDVDDDGVIRRRAVIAFAGWTGYRNCNDGGPVAPPCY